MTTEEVLERIQRELRQFRWRMSGEREVIRTRLACHGDGSEAIDCCPIGMLVHEVPAERRRQVLRRRKHEALRARMREVAESDTQRAWDDAAGEGESMRKRLARDRREGKPTTNEVHAAALALVTHCEPDTVATAELLDVPKDVLGDIAYAADHPESALGGRLAEALSL